MTISTTTTGSGRIALTDQILSDRLEFATTGAVATAPTTADTLSSTLLPGSTAQGGDIPALLRAAPYRYAVSTMPLNDMLLRGGAAPSAPVISPIRDAGKGWPSYDLSTGQAVKTAFQTYAVTGDNDPLVSKQWHLTRLGDLNAVWKDYTGKDVHVGVYDSGIQYGHWDLGANYDASREVVVEGYKYDGDYRPASGPHGTSVAGIIAAAKNGLGGVGIAYDAKLTGINIFDPYSLDDSQPGIAVNGGDIAKFYEAVRQSDRYDVTNHSWGGRSPYATLFSRSTAGSFNYEMVKALSNGTDNGRAGLGTIHVAAAGNDRLDGQSDAWKTDRHIIAVGAYRESDGSSSYYTSSGAHLLVSAPSNDYTALGGTGQVTTDLLGRDGYNTEAKPGSNSDYTDNFGGTSGATPVVSGVVTLMLDANDSLGWRDVQDILAYSAKLPVAFDTGMTAVDYDGRQMILNSSKFEMGGKGADWNGGATHYSRDYGYGAVDAYSAVRMAEVWSLFGAAKTSANEVSVSTGTVNVGLSTPTQGENTNLTKYSSFVGTPKSFNFVVDKAVDVEHLDLTINFSNNIMFEGATYNMSLIGAKFKLIAPDGTSAFIDTTHQPFDLAFGGPWMISADKTMEFTFGLAGFRGVDMLGTWTLQFESIDNVFDQKFGGELTINSLKLDAHGSQINPNDVFTYTNEFFTMAAIAGEGGRKTLTDSDGGTDWINAAAVSKDTVVSLWEGATTTFGGVDAFTIAKGSKIENAVTGDGNDRLLGNTLDNELHGMRGDDVLWGDKGNDKLYGGDGNDRLDGGSGADLMDGGAGNDTFVVDNAGDQVIEGVNGGTDRVYASIDYTLTANVENLYLTGAARVGTGNALDNSFYGTSASETFYGLDGNDTIWAAQGDDWLNGGAGNDKLYGQEGDDILDGGAGADTMEGGIGNDIYFVDNAGDKVIEYFVNGTGGVDTVYASVDWTLGANVENLMLAGESNINGYGNALANVLIGNDGANLLSGGAGNDTLMGGAGNDTLLGGAGADTFVFGPGFGKDVVGDFGKGDILDLGAFNLDTAPVVTDLGSDTLIDLGDGNTILLVNIDPGQLTYTGHAFGFAG